MKIKEQEPEGCVHCGKTVRSLGLCSSHYYRFNKYGDALAIKPKRAAPARDWLFESLRQDTDECIIWPFTRSKDGYARVDIDGVLVFASRYVCEIENGPPPSDRHEAAHTCGKGHSGCINRKHVVWKTHRDNIADKRVHGTLPQGEKHNQAKLTEASVLEIRSLRGLVSRKQIAMRFGVGRSTIDNIIDGVTWRHV